MKTLLLPFSWMYSWGMMLRNLAFNRAWLLTKELPCPVISVGNLTIGGTGKTPMVIALAEKLLGMGITPGIISRGYRRNSKGTMVVSNGHKILLNSALAGDEPALMAQRLPKVPVVVDKVRNRGGLALLQKYKPDVILLDDGFQHRWLHRDLDIVLIDAQQPIWKEKILPAGRLRESISGLQRADIVIFSRVDEGNLSTEDIKRIKVVSKAPVLQSIHKPKGWVSFQGEVIPLNEEPPMKNPLLISGIATPKDFEHTIRSIGIIPAAHLVFPDHVNYNPRTLDRIAQEYRKVKADSIITTEKDLVKLPLMLQALRVWALRISLKVIEGAEELDQLINKNVVSKLPGKK